MSFRPTALAFAIAAFAAVPAFAQGQAAPPTVAGLANLSGQVMVSAPDGLVAATANQRVAAGTRVLTMAGAKVTVAYDNGCRVEIAENRQFTVRTGDCAALMAEVSVLAPSAIGGTALASVSPFAQGAWFAGAAAISGGTYLLVKDNGVSGQ